MVGCVVQGSESQQQQTSYLLSDKLLAPEVCPYQRSKNAGIPPALIANRADPHVLSKQALRSLERLRRRLSREQAGGERVRESRVPHMEVVGMRSRAFEGVWF